MFALLEFNATKSIALIFCSPFVQNLLVSACLFFNPGLYLAIAVRMSPQFETRWTRTYSS